MKLILRVNGIDTLPVLPRKMVTKGLLEFIAFEYMREKPVFRRPTVCAVHLNPLH